MKNINPTRTSSWQELKKHYEQIKNIKISDLFRKDINRFSNLSIILDDLILVDLSKNIITYETIEKLCQLANEVDLQHAIYSMFSGSKINSTENRAVLHTALRNISNKTMVIDNRDIMLEINKVLFKMKKFSKLVIDGEWKGYSGKKITDIVNIGIGGSDIGARMVIKALSPFKNHLKIHFISNVDGSHIAKVLKQVNPETTIFIISSKNFKTLETLTNTNSIFDWFLKYTKNRKYTVHHFFAVSMNIQAAVNYGIYSKNIFKIWDWVGGRYSLWSAVGLPIILSIGFDNFMKLLSGAHYIDKHFLSTEFKSNVPVQLALISIWYNNFFNAETEAILPYSYNMRYFVEYLQQLGMESNGKSIDRNGNIVSWKTSPIIWGAMGTNSQHTFCQLIHQGTRLIPCDFIASVKSPTDFNNHHKILLSNFFAQTKVLAFGTQEKEDQDIINKNISSQLKVSSFRTLNGNNPTNSILLRDINPYSLGMLIALYEHKIFVQGVILNISSFDQWGVELGKKIADHILPELDSSSNTTKFDTSTNGLIDHFKQWY